MNNFKLIKLNSGYYHQIIIFQFSIQSPKSIEFYIYFVKFPKKIFNSMEGTMKLVNQIMDKKISRTYNLSYFSSW